VTFRTVIVLVVLFGIGWCSYQGREVEERQVAVRADVARVEAEHAKMDRETKAKADAEAKAKFSTERASIIAEAKRLFAQRDYERVSSLGNRYAASNDSELTSLAQKADSEIITKTMADAKARKKREGVRIGMTEQDVLDSSWGRPTSVNRTTTAHGTHEQWVYGNAHNGYLYLDNGILTSIQN
jgi:hypothetical protein